MKLKALIIDDEADSRSVLRKLAEQHCPGIDICGEASNVSAAYKMIIDHKPQVIFLDIQMPGDNGFAILKKFIEIPFEVIFVTSYDEYAIEAIKFNALDYLLKPVEINELKTTVARLEKVVEKKEVRQKQLVNLIIHLEREDIEKKLAVHKNDTVVLLPLRDITHMQAERNYTQIVTSSNEFFTSSKNLGEFEDLLEGYRQFVRINKQYIVNVNFINDYSKGEPCMLTVNNQFCFEISRRKKQEILDVLKGRQD
ncbi:MAG: LytTR family two component transcriptional regulator [Bacteroidetes bacterium]|nr:MAG: LytTR family two component transcriptional regulator [Bacteroidota bacterium]